VKACGLAANAVLSEYWPERTDLSHDTGLIQMRARQGTQQLSALLSVLAGVQPQGHKDFLSLLGESREYVDGVSILLWVVPVDTPELVAAAGRFVQQGQKVLIFARRKSDPPQPGGRSAQLVPTGGLPFPKGVELQP